VTSYLIAVRRHVVLVIVGVLLGTGLGAVAAVTDVPRYSSTTTLFVSVGSRGEASSLELAQGSTAAQNKVVTFVDVVRTPGVLGPVIDRLGLDTTPTELAGRVSAENTFGTVLIDVSVTDPDPAVAASVADEIGVVLAEVVTETLERPSDGSDSLVLITPVEPAEVADTPSTAGPLVVVGLATLAGLVLGLLAAVVRSGLDTRLHDDADVARVTDAPLLGAIDFDPSVTDSPLAVADHPQGTTAEAFRTLRTNLWFLEAEPSAGCLVVTSSVPGEGKTTTTANLALALAENGSSVVVVDGDLRRPRLAEVLGVEGGVGLTDVLIGRASLDDVLQPRDDRPLTVLASGAIPPNPSELLGSEAMRSLLAELSARFDHVLIDAPPLLPVTDSVLLSRLARGAVLVTASGRVTSSQLEAATRSVETAGGTVLGTVLTMTPRTARSTYDYTSGYAPEALPEPRRAHRLPKRLRTASHAETDPRRRPVAAGRRRRA
jgi:capsular exopolysaccharide synthesis family protein